jgi:serine/threonine-protein kinase
MTPVEVSALVTQIARGLEVAHAEGVLHRDLKPSNIFLTPDEDGAELVKILDFGIARRDRSVGLDTRFVTAKGVLFGTPSYMSPEQASASSDLDARTDLWSLAVMAYEALTGKLPVMGADTSHRLANLRAAKIVPLRLRNAELGEACERFSSAPSRPASTTATPRARSWLSTSSAPSLRSRRRRRRRRLRRARCGSIVGPTGVRRWTGLVAV